MNFPKFILRFSKINKLFITLIDLGLIVLGVYLSFALKFGFIIPERNFDPFISLIPTLLIISLCFFNVYGLFTIGRKTYTETFFSLVVAVFMITVTSVATTFFLRGFAFPRAIFITSYFLNLILLGLWRFLLVRIHRNIHGVKKIMIVDSENCSNELAEKINSFSSRWYNVSYIYTKDIEEHEEDFVKYLKDVDMVIMSPNIKQKVRYVIIDYCHRFSKEISIIPTVYDIQILKSSVMQFDDVMAFALRKMELPFEQKVLKRILDFVFAGIGIIVAFPLMILISIAVLIESKGGVFYYQERITYGGKSFKLLKFRSMQDNAEEATGPVLCDRDDPRITRVGKFLRKTRFDELPQLFNILIGDMSIVGPRPERQVFIDEFVKTVPSYKYRLNVKAGLTGLAQILGKYSTTFDEKLNYDLLYITEYSVLLDIKIIFQTFKVLFQGEKAEGKSVDKFHHDNCLSIDEVASTKSVDQ